MKSVLAMSVLAVASGRELFYTSDAGRLKELFEQFKQNYGRRYSTMDEEVKRFDLFVNNLKNVDARNALELIQGGSSVHGVTKFSDWSEEEFMSYLTLDVSQVNAMGGNNATDADIKPYTGPAGLVDWTGKYTTAVKDQGYCGSCWAFSASEQIESDTMRMLGKTYTLSPEQLVDCDSRSSGCNGGWPEWAYSYVNRAGGIETESSYPYSAYYGREGSCKADDSKFVVTVDSYTTISTGETAMANYVKSTGTLSICIDASNWSSYTGGIMSVCGTSVNHAVQAVGVDDSNGGYWKVRNSWGSSWGESGFIRLAYGKNTCNVSYKPSYTKVSNA